MIDTMCLLIPQDYIDSMEGATKSGLLCADVLLRDAKAIKARATA